MICSRQTTDNLNITIKHEQHLTVAKIWIFIQAYYKSVAKIWTKIIVYVVLNVNRHNIKMTKQLTSNTSYFIVCEATCFGP